VRKKQRKIKKSNLESKMLPKKSQRFIRLQKSPKKRNDLKFCNDLPVNDLYVWTVPRYNGFTGKIRIYRIYRNHVVSFEFCTLYRFALNVVEKILGTYTKCLEQISYMIKYPAYTKPLGLLYRLDNSFPLGFASIELYIWVKSIM